MDAGQHGPLSELLALLDAELRELELDELEGDALLLKLEELLLPEDELPEELEGDPDEELSDERLPPDETERLPLCESLDEPEEPLLRPLDSRSSEPPLFERDPEDGFCDWLVDFDDSD